MADEELLAELKAADEGVGQVSLEAISSFEQKINALRVELEPLMAEAVETGNIEEVDRIIDRWHQVLRDEYDRLREAKGPEYDQLMHFWQEVIPPYVEQSMAEAQRVAGHMAAEAMPDASVPASDPEPRIGIQEFSDLADSFVYDMTRIAVDDPKRLETIDRLVANYTEIIRKAAKEMQEEKEKTQKIEAIKAAL